MKIKMLPAESPWRTVALVVAVVFADVMMSFLSLGLGIDDGTVPDPENSGLEWARFGFAPLLAPLGAVALVWRHRFPKSVAAAAAVLGALSFSGLAFMVALFLLARRRIDWWVAAVIVLAVGAETLLGVEPLTWGVLLFATVGFCAIAAWGGYRGQRSRLRESQVAALKARAERVEAEHAADIEHSRLAERHRIAREMHDTLAHRMSLVAVQAAALEVDAPDTETAGAARSIRETAHAALGELRDVLGVLHEDGTTGQGDWQPVQNPENGTAGTAGQMRTAPSGIAQIPGLLGEWRQAGVAVEFTPSPELEKDLPDAVSRAAFRVVQEGITNVARHAPEAAASVNIEVVRTGKGAALHVTVANGPAVPGEAAVGAGMGLVGLAERIELLGGTLSHGAAGNGFELAARIPLSGHCPGEDGEMPHE